MSERYRAVPAGGSATAAFAATALIASTAQAGGRGNLVGSYDQPLEALHTVYGNRPL